MKLAYLGWAVMALVLLLGGISFYMGDVGRGLTSWLACVIIALWAYHLEEE